LLQALLGNIGLLGARFFPFETLTCADSSKRQGSRWCGSDLRARSEISRTDQVHTLRKALRPPSRRLRAAGRRSLQQSDGNHTSVKVYVSVNTTFKHQCCRGRFGSS